ncbi:DinB family protein [Sphingobacterium sp. lm-10]|uniref:DinB family protein n=1 Tax=Sphingobacterium sp. lm-10 TaxID=2944904 RepID=UPI002021EC83|nr:DinB family protein [Sphingobacterium sp. lm-10]MCL7988312.1 DinB family protein [Sphingobacterium sp. lm-10]
MNQLKSDDFPAFYRGYIESVTNPVMDELMEQLTSFPLFVRDIPKDKETYRYTEDKWTVKEVLCHILDSERVMAYRALRFARNDMTALASFEQDEFVANGRHDERSLESIVKEFTALRQSNICLFETFNETELNRKGMASDRLISVQAFLYIIAGHLNHHRTVLATRYLKEDSSNNNQQEHVV